MLGEIIPVIDAIRANKNLKEKIENQDVEVPEKIGEIDIKCLEEDHQNAIDTKNRFEDKAKTILKLQSKNSKVIMVGDGINDAPALAYADVGVSLGGGCTDAAIETSDVVIQTDDPMALPAVMNLSKKTMKVVKENFGLVIGINTLGLVFSAAGVLPVFWGAVLHNSSTIFVVSNSIRLLFSKIENKR